MKAEVTRQWVVIAAFAILTTLSAAGQQLQTASQKPTHKASSKPSRGARLINPPALAKPLSTYSQLAEVTGGKLLFIAGQVAVDKDGKVVGRGDFRAQVEQVFRNIKIALEAGGGDMSSLIKTNYFVAESVDPKELAVVREVRDRYINVSAPPTSTFVVVSRLANPDYLIEVEAVAHVQK